ncbi:uncharacterized protein CPUR_06328 [Claviceps purpurea 20.1]|uniref:BTB domain-containing protein n=1 Tax=Claviceps purpurea (strain 20.1) TaxID=1111077 RepID=M1WE03_CLAP2|nr:hypothetical protein E4U46_005631 [Claviceps purpurea]CCE32468.1 uncharacterized protein CPUR_06328 [Claviceps purpurea 20.1]
MEASLSEEIFASQPCVFVVGEDKREFLLHSDLVKRESEALGKIIDASFAEGRKGYVVLRDDDVEIISAFAQFIYTGYYHLSFNMSAPDSANESHDKGNRGNNVAQFTEFRRPHNGLWRRFIQRNHYENQEKLSDSESYMIPYEASRFEIDDSDVPYLNAGYMDKDCSELFISHVRIFVFAQYYAVEALMDLSMQRLHEALCGFSLSIVRIGDILALIRYCYEQPDLKRLKKMVAMYSAAVVNSQIQEVVIEDFEDLLTERGDFAADMAWFLACRVTCSSEY